MSEFDDFGTTHPRYCIFDLFVSTTFYTMDTAARKKLNLKAIRRYDAAIVNILDQSPHAALYYFSNEKREWVKRKQTR